MASSTSGNLDGWFASVEAQLEDTLDIPTLETLLDALMSALVSEGLVKKAENHVSKALRRLSKKSKDFDEATDHADELESVVSASDYDREFDDDAEYTAKETLEALMNAVRAGSRSLKQ